MSENHQMGFRMVECLQMPEGYLRFQMLECHSIPSQSQH
jgi:hypothetical protein